MKKRFQYLGVWLTVLSIPIVNISCAPDYKNSSIPELKLLLFPNGILSGSTCYWDSSNWDTCIWSD